MSDRVGWGCFPSQPYKEGGFGRRIPNQLCKLWISPQKGHHKVVDGNFKFPVWQRSRCGRGGSSWLCVTTLGELRQHKLRWGSRNLNNGTDYVDVRRGVKVTITKRFTALPAASKLGVWVITHVTISPGTIFWGEKNQTTVLWERKKHNALRAWSKS